MDLRTLIGVFGLFDPVCVGIYIIVALRGTGQPIRKMQPRIEPLRRVRCGHLPGQHIAELVAEGLGILGRVKIIVRDSPMCPASGQPVKDLPGIPFPSQCRGSLFVQERGALVIVLRHPGLAEIFLGQNIDGQLRPVFGG